MAFNKTTTIPGVQSTQQLMGPGSFGVSQNNIFIFGNRRSKAATETTLPIPSPASGYPQYEYYKTYELPEFCVFDGNALVSYFSSCGFTTGWGYSSEFTVDGASYVDITTLASKNRAIVYYSSESNVLSNLVGSGISGTFDDITANKQGTMIEAQTGSFIVSGITYDSYVVLQSNDFASITAGDNIKYTYTDYSASVPNPETTEPFIMNLYYAAASANIPDATSNPNRTVSTPRVFFSILPDSANSGVFGPTGATITLPTPSAVSGSTITFTSSGDNLYLIPRSELGVTKISQGATYGTVASAELSGGKLVVTLKDISGTFTTSSACSMVLDSGVTCGTYQIEYFANRNKSLQQIAMPYEISTAAHITTTYKSIFDHVNELNQPKHSVNGQAICQIAYARIGITDIEALNTLPTNVNSWQHQPIFYNYVAKIGDANLTAGNVAAAYAMVIGSNVYPINPQGGIVLNSLPIASGETGSAVSIGGYADMIQKLGWNVVAVSTNMQAFVVAPRTGQITLPGLPTPDNEFYPEYLWQTIDYCRLTAIQYLQSLGLGQIRQTPSVMKRIKGDLFAQFSRIATAGLIKPMSSSQIIVKQDESNPLGIDVDISLQVTPGLYFSYVKFSVFSSLVTIS